MKTNIHYSSNYRRLLTAALTTVAMCNVVNVYADEVETLKNVSSAYSLDGHDELYITDASQPFKDGGTVNLTSEDAWVVFENVKPNDVVSKWSKNILIDGETFEAGKNGRVAIYRHGAVVMAHGSDFKPLTVYTEQDCKGESDSYGLNIFYTNDADEVIPDSLVEELRLDNSIRSFVLKRGYMATFATDADGMGYSRVFVADKEDLTVSVMPELLDKKTSFVRVRQWELVSKKGWAGSIWTSMPEGLKYVTEQCDYTNSTWYYNWGSDPVGTENPKRTYINYNQEFVPEKWGAGGSGKSLYTLEDVSHLIGYNEPDHKEQSNVSVEKAIEEWPILQKTGLRLGSPATTDFNWLYSFMSECKKRNYRVDYVVIHAYWGGLSALEWYNKIKAVHDRTGRPIWIKEWNNGANWTKETWPSGTDAQYEKQLRDLKGILTVMDTASFIERYSIYNWVEEKRSIISYNTATLTPAGKYYAANQPDYFFNRNNEVVPEWSVRSAPVIEGSSLTTDNTVCITWDDENKEFVDAYTVECSTNGEDFETVATVTDGSGKADISLEGMEENSVVLLRVSSHSLYGASQSSQEIRVNIAECKTGEPVVTEVIIPNRRSYTVFNPTFGTLPVTVAGPLTYRNKMPLGMRLSDVQTNGYAYNLQTWDYQQSPTIANPDTVAIMSVEPGRHQWGGIEVEAAHIDGIGTEWKEVKFATPFNSTPVVFATQSSNIFPHASSIRVRNVTCEGFEIQIQYEEELTVEDVSESVCYIAATQGKGRIGDMDVCVGLSDEAVAGDNLSGGYTVEYGMTYEQTPLLLAAMQTVTDDITSVLRVKARTNSTAVVFKDREKSGGHTRVSPEQVGWMSISRTTAPTSISKVEEAVSNDLCYSRTAQKVYRLSGNTIGRALLTDVMGRVLGRFTDCKEISLSHLPAGAYIVSTDNSDSLKFMK